MTVRAPIGSFSMLPDLRELRRLKLEPWYGSLLCPHANRYTLVIDPEHDYAILGKCNHLRKGDATCTQNLLVAGRICR